ncbi:GH25 family lysozyme [Asanoa sp. WMMD1127]|uniref:GH25 family lysozyme n=1 Tax=Asanoa sp. WMMD1127 TaxID=3016107 RepID=UPI002417BBDE|nr:GH25 family lysozyme [Asanoa sp. WMMD1127]MDG4825011.1 GH25 family lysozyme [Asanoa sp. WMMD1127]
MRFRSWLTRFLPLLALSVVGFASQPVAAQGAPTGYSVTGIDVSHYQGAINWEAVADSGVDFAYAKATEGTGFTDPTYVTNRSGARANGIYFGAYHFGRPDQGDPRGQANRLVDTSRYSSDGTTLPPMLDIEWSASQPTCFGLSTSAMVSWISQFLDQVRARTGQKAMIYTNPNWWNPCTGNSTAFGSYPLFHSRDADTPGALPSGWSRFTLWQWTSSGSVPGVSGRVDRDVFNGSLAGLRALCNATTGRNAPALAHDDGDATMTIHRWRSTGTSFARTADYSGEGAFSLAKVGDRVASGDVDGDGTTDIVMAYQISDGTFGFYVFDEGLSSAGRWYTSGPFGLDSVGGRLVVADFTGDGRAEPALVRDNGDATVTIYRWTSTGSSFVRTTDYVGAGAFTMSNVGDRVAAGDVTGDGKADIVMAYQISDGTFGYYVWSAGLSSLGRWYTSGIFNLDRVAGRLVVDDFTGDGKAEPALVRDDGDATMSIYRWTSTGSGFARTTDYLGDGTFMVSNIGNRVAAGDVTGDGKADIVMAYQISDGTFGYYVFNAGLTDAGRWYTSGPYNLDPVAGRLVLGNW